MNLTDNPGSRGLFQWIANNYTGWVKQMSPLTKCDTIAPNLEINIDPDAHADMWYKDGIDRSRNTWAMSSWKRRTTFAPTQGVHISGYVPSRHRYCNSHISSYEWKIWIITTRQLRVYVTLFFPYFSHPYFIKAMESHIGQHISQATEMQTLCWSKTRPSFSGADNSYISWPINTIFVSANRHVYPDQYPGNEFHLSQNWVQ